MEKILRTDSTHKDFVNLVGDLNALLKQRDGDQHDFYSQYNQIDQLHQVVLFYADDKAVACGAIKAFNNELVEIKRMYARPEYRGQGMAGKVLTELESWASELGYFGLVLETGINLPEAIQFYQKKGYKLIPNYGQYIGIAESFCFQKAIDRKEVLVSDSEE